MKYNKENCQTAAREHPLRARTAPSPVRQRPITGVGAPQTAVGVRTRVASVRQFGETPLLDGTAYRSRRSAP